MRAQMLWHVARRSPSAHRLLDWILGMLALLCNAALNARILVWQRSGRSVSPNERFRSLTAVRRKDWDWPEELVLGGRRENALPVTDGSRDARRV